MKLDEIRDALTGIDPDTYESATKPMFALVKYKPTSRPREYEFDDESQNILQTPTWCKVVKIFPNDFRGLIVTLKPFQNSRPFLVPHTREILAIITYEEASVTHPELVI